MFSRAIIKEDCDMQTRHHSNLAPGVFLALSGKVILTGQNAMRVAYNWRERHKLELLLRYDDARLDDLGVSRQDIKDVLILPLDRNPSSELERRRGMHRRG